MTHTRLFATALAGAVFCVPFAAAEAAVVVNVDKSTQRMSVVVDGVPRYNWPVSTGRAGYGTPNGTYAPQRLERSHFSRAYYNSPMPYSIFFHGGYAIHGSYAISQLGGPASHGCVRLHPSNAATLFSLVQQQGAGNTRIVVGGSTAVMADRGARLMRARARAGEYPAQTEDDDAPTYQSYPPAYSGSWGQTPFFPFQRW